MNCALLLSDESYMLSSHGHELLLLGRPLAAYPLIVALSCPAIGRVFVCTWRPELKDLAVHLGAQVLGDAKPGEAAQSVARRCGEEIRELLAGEGAEFDSLVVLYENAATVTPQILKAGLDSLAKHAELDSAISVSSSRQWSPANALRIGSGDELEPILLANAATSATAEAWFPDLGATIVRSKTVLAGGWLGHRVLALRQTGGLAVTESWHLGAAEVWVKAHELDMLFKARRTSWAHFYDSERSILSTVQLSNHASILDIGSDPGGLGVALRERFGASSYTAVVPKEADRGEVLAIYPEAKVTVGNASTLARLATDGFDLVSALGIGDSPGLLEKILPAAFGQVMEFGCLVFNVRLTTGPSIDDEAKSYQDISVGRGEGVRRPYVVRNVEAVMASILSLQPARVVAYGYMGRPSPTASTPLKEICFAVFAVTRGGETPPIVPHVDLQLPAEYRVSHRKT